MNDDDKQPFDLDSPEAIRQMNIRQAKLGALAQQIAMAGLLELKRKMENQLPLNMTGAEARALLDSGLRLEGVARGLPEEMQPLPEADPPKRVN
jgi:hypothetical protein